MCLQLKSNLSYFKTENTQPNKKEYNEIYVIQSETFLRSIFYSESFRKKICFHFGNIIAEVEHAEKVRKKILESGQSCLFRKIFRMIWNLGHIYAACA